MWRTRFHADPRIVGSTVRLNREPWTVVGVLPAGFQHVGGDFRSPAQGDTVALWWPLGLGIGEQPQRGWHFTNAIARLKPDATLLAAEQDLNRILEDLGRRYPENYAAAKALLEPLPDSIVGRSGPTVWIVAAAGALVLGVDRFPTGTICNLRRFTMGNVQRLSTAHPLAGQHLELEFSSFAEVRTRTPDLSRPCGDPLLSDPRSRLNFGFGLSVA